VVTCLAAAVVAVVAATVVAVHVQGLQGNIVPLHVSNYAVLVTNVPKEYEFEELEGLNRKLRRTKPGLLARMLQAVV
jgi:hypothetical protein